MCSLSISLSLAHAGYINTGRRSGRDGGEEGGGGGNRNWNTNSINTWKRKSNWNANVWLDKENRKRANMCLNFQLVFFFPSLWNVQKQSSLKEEGIKECGKEQQNQNENTKKKNEINDVT